MRRKLLLSWLAIAIVCLAALGSTAAWAKPTISGRIKSFNPGARRLQLERSDGSIKTIVFTEKAQYIMWGKPVPPAQFRIQMQVAVRICGSLGDNPLSGDLLTDLGSSSSYVSKTATGSGNAPTGTFASVGGSGGVVNGTVGPVTPSVVGPLGMGGNFQGSLTNPGVNGPVNNSAFPAIPQTTNSTANAQPSPLGSPFTGQVIAGGAGNNPYANRNSNIGYGQYPGGFVPNGGATGGAQNPYAAAQNPYVNPQNPYAAAQNPYGTSGIAGSQVPSISSMINGDSDDDEENSDPFGGMNAGQASGPMGMQIVQFQGQVMNVDPTNRVISVIPQGAAQPVQVSLPLSINPVSGAGQPVQLNYVRPGMGIGVQGISNAAGIIEARRVQLAQ